METGGIKTDLYPSWEVVCRSPAHFFFVANVRELGGEEADIVTSNLASIMMRMMKNTTVTMTRQ